MRKNDKIAELNSEALSEQEMNAYLSLVQEDTPDLWDRIEDGFAREAENVKDNGNDKVINITSRKMKRKYIGIIAACVLAVVIAIPVLGGAMGERNKSDNSVCKDSDNASYDGVECYPTEAPNEETAIDGNGQNNYMADTAVNEPTAGDDILTQNAAEGRAENTEDFIKKYIMVSDSVYEYDGVYVNKLPDGYALIGTVQEVDSEYPDENFKGTCLEVGQNIYGSSNEEQIIYIEVSENGFEKFIKK